MNTTKFTADTYEAVIEEWQKLDSIPGWAQTVKAELQAEIERVKTLPEFRDWLADTVAKNGEPRPNIPQWNEEDCLIAWVLRNLPDFTDFPVEMPKWATHRIIRPETQDGSDWSITHKATVSGVEISESFSVSEDGEVSCMDLTARIEGDPSTGVEEVFVQADQIDDVIAALTLAQQMLQNETKLTGDEIRNRADQLYRMSYAIDEANGVPVMPDEAGYDAGINPVEDGNDYAYFNTNNGVVTVTSWLHNGDPVDISANIRDEAMTSDDITRAVRALRAAEAYHFKITR